MHIIICTGTNSTIFTKEIKTHITKEGITDINLISVPSLERIPNFLTNKNNEKVFVMLSDFGLDTTLNFIRLNELLANNPSVDFYFISKEDRTGIEFVGNNIQHCLVDKISLTTFINQIETIYLENN